MHMFINKILWQILFLNKFNSNNYSTSEFVLKDFESTYNYADVIVKETFFKLHMALKISLLAELLWKCNSVNTLNKTDEGV